MCIVFARVRTTTTKTDRAERLRVVFTYASARGTVVAVRVYKSTPRESASGSTAARTIPVRPKRACDATMKTRVSQVRTTRGRRVIPTSFFGLSLSANRTAGPPFVDNSRSARTVDLRPRHTPCAYAYETAAVGSPAPADTPNSGARLVPSGFRSYKSYLSRLVNRNSVSIRCRHYTRE